MDQLLEYSFRITPGLLLLIFTYILLSKEMIASKLFVLVFGFILVRDAMTDGILAIWCLRKHSLASLHRGWSLVIDAGIDFIAAYIRYYLFE